MNRNTRKWTAAEQIYRVAWSLASVLFWLSPRSIWGWRCLLLRLFGARIGKHVHIYPSVKITIPWNLEIGDYTAIGDGAILYSLGKITIGPRVTISQRAHLCAGTHDWRQPDMPLLKKTIEIHSDVWVAAEAFIGPGAQIGQGAVVGARSVVTRDVSSGLVVAGNPAREIGRREK